MIIQEYILKKYLFPLMYNLVELESLINSHMAEVECITSLNQSTHLIIGQINQIKKIPHFDKLSLVQVNIGEQVLSIVCGANNLQLRQKVVIAPNGAYLESMKTKIIKKHIAGVESNGMICSAKELGLNALALTTKEEEGILVLEEDAPIGKCVLEYLGLKGFILELSLTPERADYLSHVGFAQDLKAISQEPSLEFKLPSIPILNLTTLPNPFKIVILDLHCFEYHIGYLKNIQVKSSPIWLRNILALHNIKPVNNIIDILNLVLIEYGIPLDVFDAITFSHDQFQIKNVSLKKQQLKLTDEQILVLQPEDLIVTNQNNIVAVAGIAENPRYSLKENTCNVIVTASFFHSKNISKTSKRLNIQNEKILRFSRGIDRTLILPSLQRAISLIQKLCPNVEVYNVISEQSKIYQNPQIDLSLDFICSKIGIVINTHQIIEVLTKLDYCVKQLDDKNLQVIAPLRRYDVKIPEDVIADLVRIYGYQQIPIFSKKNQILPSLRTKKQSLIYNLKHFLANIGLHEIITYSLISEKNLRLFSDKDNDGLRILNPISQEHNILRTHLSGSLIETLRYNQKYNNLDNALFELSTVYDSQQKEEVHLSLGLSGTFIKSGWFKQNIDSSFFLLKSFLTRIEEFLGVYFELIKTTDFQQLHPGQQAHIYLNNQCIGFMGQTHPSLNNEYHLTSC
ncbi:phenylalanine--tRNA ligase subunit beta, partial [Candidatus Phytoplasma phoenicium]